MSSAGQLCILVLFSMLAVGSIGFVGAPSVVISSSSSSNGGASTSSRHETIVTNRDGTVTRTLTIGQNGAPTQTTITTMNANQEVIQQINSNNQQDSEEEMRRRKEEDYEAMLRRLKAEAAARPIKEERANYVDDDADLEEILELIGDTDNNQDDGANEQRVEREHQAGHQTPSDVTFDSTCPICMDSLKARPVTMLNCGHLFHKHCVAQWKGFDVKEQSPRRVTCPMCRIADWYDP